MNFELSLLNSNLLLKQAGSEVLSCNDINETNDLMSDDELIKFMNISYDSICQGSLELFIHNFLSSYDKNYRDIPFNIYERVLLL
ncbi:DUF6323 family protein [Acetoanaerobium noterae]|uniref:DUF6323 family protein n=1 Tax=Acetoanaerobium noterae TaxID=745369 RepID=UPI0028A839B5|nr:DUF6323 family protein [Acetoanaerobium noterae]